MDTTQTETKQVPGNVTVETWWIACSVCGERIYEDLPEGSMRKDFLYRIEAQGWATRPTLCPGCQKK